MLNGHWNVSKGRGGRTMSRLSLAEPDKRDWLLWPAVVDIVLVVKRSASEKRENIFFLRIFLLLFVTLTTARCELVT